MSAPCPRCKGTGWLVRHYYVCDCRAGDYAWAKWEGMSIEEYDRRAGQVRAGAAMQVRPHNSVSFPSGEQP